MDVLRHVRRVAQKARILVKKHQLIAFFVTTFGISWGLPGVGLLVSSQVEGIEFGLGGPVYYLIVWAPAIAAITVVGVTRGRTGIRSYVGRLVPWRVGVRWYVAVLLGVIFLNVAGASLGVLLGQNTLSFPFTPIYTVVPAVALSLVLDPGAVEELGWRGFALPHLQARFGGLVASVVLGTVWGLWHLPALVISSFEQSQTGLPVYVAVLVFVLWTVSLSVLLTVVYNGTGGSILLACLFHWATNLLFYLGVIGGELTVIATVTAVVAVAVVIRFGDLLERKNVYTDIIPGVAPAPISDTR